MNRPVSQKEFDILKKDVVEVFKRAKLLENHVFTLSNSVAAIEKGLAQRTKAKPKKKKAS